MKKLISLGAPLKNLALLVLLGSLAVLTGCGPTKIYEDTYRDYSGDPGQWEVFHDGKVKIQVDEKAKVVTISGIKSAPNVPGTKLKLTGSGYKFKCYDIERVIVGGGVEAYVTNCSQVDAQNDSTLHVYSCANVRRMPKAKIVERHGGGTDTELQEEEKK